MKVVTKVGCGVVVGVILSVLGASLAIAMNDKVQDTKIDLLIQSVNEIKKDVKDINSYLLGK
jgi:hypothetical protein